MGVVRTLAASEEAAYLGRACAALAAARLNAQYPPARAAGHHLRCMGESIHGGLYAPIQVDVRSGLPTYREWIRVLTDAGVAEAGLAQLPAEAVLAARAEAEPGSIHGKLWLKAGYYRALGAAPLIQLDRVSIALRRVDVQARCAHFTAVLDKLDPNGCLIRYTIELAQHDAFWQRPLIELDGGAADRAEAFRSLVFQLASFDAELTFARLCEHEHVRVERVARGCIGPIFAPDTRAPGPLAPLLALPAAWIASFSLDIAATDLAADRDNDPLDTWLGDLLSAPARAEYEQARSRFGYRVFKDRKFVAPAALHEGLTALCQAQGTRNIVYAASEGTR